MFSKYKVALTFVLLFPNVRSFIFSATKKLSQFINKTLFQNTYILNSFYTCLNQILEAIQDSSLVHDNRELSRRQVK
jgi:hypothetical protein